MFHEIASGEGQAMNPFRKRPQEDEEEGHHEEEPTPAPPSSASSPPKNFLSPSIGSPWSPTQLNIISRTSSGYHSTKSSPNLIDNVLENPFKALPQEMTNATQAHDGGEGVEPLSRLEDQQKGEESPTSYMLMTDDDLENGPSELPGAVFHPDEEMPDEPELLPASPFEQLSPIAPLTISNASSGNRKPHNDTPLPSYTDAPTQRPMNPTIALSNDLIDRQILSSHEEVDEPEDVGRLQRSNAQVRRTPEDILSNEYKSVIKRSKSLKSYNKRTDSTLSDKPVLFAQTPARSHSLNSGKPTPRGREPPVESKKVSPHSSRKPIDIPESPYFLLTDDSEMNFTKGAERDPQHTKTTDTPGGDNFAPFPLLRNFYNAQDATLNFASTEERSKHWERMGQGVNVNDFFNPDGTVPSAGDTPSADVTHQEFENPKHATADQGKKRQNYDVLMYWIWALAIVVIVLLCVFVPLIIIYSRGTETSVGRYLKNITPEHREKLLLPFTSSSFDNPGKPVFQTQFKEVGLPSPSLSNATELPLKQETRVRGGLRNAKFRTQTLAGVSSFNQIPLFHQNNPLIALAMNNPQLHNVFYGIDYAPQNVVYPECGSTLEDVMVDVLLLSQVTSRIRTYGTQCTQAKNVLESIRSLNLNMSLSAGVWIGANTTNNERQLSELKEVLQEYPREYFESIFVGNEVLFREDQNKSQLIKYIKDVKSFVQIEMNWDLPVGTSDIGHKTDTQVLNNCDFYGSNTHPFFHGDDVATSTHWVFDYMKYQIEPFKHLAITQNQIPKVMISEVGWPYDGGSYMNATAGAEQMQQFLDSWVCEANDQKYPWYFFEAFDEPWKERYHREDAQWDTHWGLFTTDRKLKEGITLPNCTLQQ